MASGPGPRSAPARRAGFGAKLTVAALALALAVASAAEQPDRDDGAAPTAIRAAGSSSVANSREGEAIVSAADMRPGSSTVGTVTIQNAGDAAGSFMLSASNLTDTAGLGGGVLSERLELVVQQTASGSTLTLYSGRLRDVPPIALPVAFAPGESRDYRFVIRFPDGGPPASPSSDDNAYQAASASLHFDWRAETDAGTPPVPAPPAPAPPAPTPPAPTPAPPSPSAPSPAPSEGGEEQPTTAQEEPTTEVQAPRTWSLSRRQDVRITVKCGQECATTARASFSRPRALRKLKLRVTRFPSGADQMTVAVKLPKRALAPVRRALSARARVTLTVTVLVADDAGNKQRLRRTLLLTR